MSDAVRRALSETQADVEVLQSHLALIRDVAAAGERALDDEDFAKRLAALLVAHLGVERAAVYLHDAAGRLELAASSSQNERFGAPREEPPQVLLELARDAVASAELVRFGGTGVGTRKPVPRGLEGSAAALTIAHGGSCLGAVVINEIALSHWNLPRLRALEIAGHTIGQALVAARHRHQLEAARRDLEVELSAATTRLAHREQALAEREGRLHALDASLARASRAKSTFLGLLSHELRTPLAAILGFAAILRDAHPEDASDEHVLALARIDSNARHLTQLVDDLLFLADAESGVVSAERGSVALRPLLRELLAAHPDAAAGARVALSIPRDAREIDADRHLLRRALFHLIGNALKFAAGRAIRIEAERTPDGGTLLRVLDAGSGLAAADVERVFEVFEQGSADDALRHGGVGLGLSLARICAAIHGGRCALRSAPSGGTCAELWIPPAGQDRGTQPAAGVASQGDRARATRTKSGRRAQGDAKSDAAPRRGRRGRPRHDLASLA